MVHPIEIETFLKLLLIEQRISHSTLVRILSRMGIKTRGQYVEMTQEAALACFEGQPFEEGMLQSAMDDGALELGEDGLRLWLRRFLDST